MVNDLLSVPELEWREALLDAREGDPYRLILCLVYAEPPPKALRQGLAAFLRAHLPQRGHKEALTTRQKRTIHQFTEGYRSGSLNDTGKAMSVEEAISTVVDLLPVNAAGVAYPLTEGRVRDVRREFASAPQPTRRPQHKPKA